ncbi:hypothetical protein [Gordonia hydrophobica]|uniref:Uncharacterized protein n=1 Tax=Gordonia hydrophobica TaxID=40516 RepID=A0ABZ2U3C7_9ACTN|nr:hypothetical protein [Gordonia hydrophobica]MBM7367514.1 hypothetical protein [Gordonia hydrophobica]
MRAGEYTSVEQTAAEQHAAMKVNADDQNEVVDLEGFVDAGRNVVTPVLQLEPDVALAVVTAFAAIVTRGKQSAAATAPDRDGITRSQVFEEGDVYMIERPFDGFFADRYLMDFYDVTDRDLCSRMHLHTGLRMVRMMTGPDTRIRVSSLAPIDVVEVPGVTDFGLDSFVDDLPDVPDGGRRDRFNVIVPPCSFVDLQVPRGVSHQFNAIGPHAVIDSVHPEESIEVFREQMSGYAMMAQTVFLADEQSTAQSCEIVDQMPENMR